MLSKQDQDKIFATVDSMKDELIKVICDTVRIPSVTPGFGVEQDISAGGETKVNQYMEPVMKAVGLQTDLFEEEKGRANLVGVYKGSGGGKSLIFNGHVDVVPAGDPATWLTATPWGAEIKDDKIWGRGSADMKAGNAASVFALKALLKAGFKPKGDVIIQHVVGEECMNTDAGTGAAIKRYPGDAAIVVEPTTYQGRLNVAAAAPGVAVMICNVLGKPVHASMRDELVRPGGGGAKVGVDAIDKGFIVYKAMRELEQQWGQSKTHPMFKRPGHFCIPISDVHAGLGGSIIADGMMLGLGFFHPPTLALEDLKKEVQEFLTTYIAFDPWLKANPPSCQWVFYWPGYDVPAEAPISQLVHKVTKQVNPECGDFYGFPAVDDAAFINQAGIPAITMGPGNLTICHGSGEYVEIRDIMDATKAYALAIAEWCGV